MNDKGLVNFRDIGGIQVPSGKLQSGYFFRSGQIAGINQEQYSFLKDQCQIRDVYDFRSTDEVKQAPDTDISGARYYHIDILSDKTSNGASLGAMITDGNQVHENMLKTYESIVLSESAQKGYHDFMLGLVEDDAPILFHCFAGKDRTGFAAAVILKVAGADDQQIMDDYLLTNMLRVRANEKLLNRFKDEMDQQQLDNLHVALMVDPDYLRHANEVLLAHFGTFDDYLKNGLNLPTDYVAQFRDKFVVR